MLNKKNQTIVKTVSYILLIIIAIYCVFPFIWMVISAFKPKDEIRTAIPSFVIHAPTLENFKKVLFQAGFINYIKNSFIVSVIACGLSMVIAVMAGYALSRYYKQKLVKVSNFAMMLSQMVLYSTDLQNETPLCTFMMSSFFDTVPMALEEAAEIDGCGKAQTIFKIILPLSVPSLISTGLYAFINAWNEFMFGYIFISTDKYRTLTPAIMLFKGANTIDWGGLMAGSVIAVIPVTIIFLFLQKYFLAGLMSGSVKG